MSDIHDLIIIGGGAIGIYANQYALKKKIKVKLIEMSGSLGGKLTSLDPQIPLSDIPGADGWTAGQLVESLISQTKKYQPEYIFKARVTGIAHKDFIFAVNTDNGKHIARSILITTGRGIFMSDFLAKLKNEGKCKAGILCEIKDEKEVFSKKVIVVGGSQETVGWALQAAHSAKSVLIINWGFIKSYGWLEGNFSVPRNMDILEPYGLLEILGDKKVTGIRVFHVASGEEKTIDADCIIMARGYHANLNDLESFGVELEKNGIKVSQEMHTSCPGIFAAGDCVYYKGKEWTVKMGTQEAARAIDGVEKYLKSVWGSSGK